MANDISKLIQLEHNLRNCESNTELYYSIVNQTREIISYEQAILFGMDLSSKLKVESISDIVAIDSTSPFVQYTQELANHLFSKYENIDIQNVNLNEDLTKELKEQLSEYSPNQIVWIPLKTFKNNIEVEFYMMLLRREVFEKKDIELLKYLSNSYKYFLFAMRKCSFSTRIKNMKINSKYFKYSLLAISLAMFLPVRMSVLAPCEIVAKDPFVVSSPIEGAIDEIKVNSNDYVKENQLLVKIKDIDLKNSYEVTQRKLDTTKAELHSAKQASFYDADKKSQLSRLQTEVKLKEAELAYSKSQLDKTNIFSKSNGIVIIDNPNEWKGKPIVTGERILLIANPLNVEIKIMLSVKDALFLKRDADAKVFLDNKIFESWSGKVTRISYKPEPTPENTISYKIIADFDNLKENEFIPKIGLRGTAKIYSEDVSLFFYLFRKPITSLRQMLAW